MDRIDRISGRGGIPGNIRRVAGTGFSVRAGALAPEQAAAAARPASELSTLLALQEHDPDDPRNRDTRRHCNELLRALTDLQKALLRDDGTIQLPRLTSLAEHMPEAADPGLAALAGMIRLRVRLEIARRSS